LGTCKKWDESCENSVYTSIAGHLTNECNKFWKCINKMNNKLSKATKYANHVGGATGEAEIANRPTWCSCTTRLM